MNELIYDLILESLTDYVESGDIDMDDAMVISEAAYDELFNESTALDRWGKRTAEKINDAKTSKYKDNKNLPLNERLKNKRKKDEAEKVLTDFEAKYKNAYNKSNDFRNKDTYKNKLLANAINQAIFDREKSREYNTGRNALKKEIKETLKDYNKKRRIQDEINDKYNVNDLNIDQRLARLHAKKNGEKIIFLDRD